MRKALTFILFVLSINSFGCSCQPMTNEELIANAEFAVIVEVIETVYRDGFPIFENKPDARVKVLKTIKGKVTQTEIVIVSSVSGECAQNFVVGRKYLISGTQRLSDYLDQENQADETEDSNEVPGDPERYDKYLNRITRDSFSLFTDMCRVSKY